MKKARRDLVSLVRYMILLLIPVVAYSQGRSTVVSAKQWSTVIDHASRPSSPQTVVLDSIPSLYFVESEASREPGTPGLPVEAFMIGIPPTGDVRLSITQTSWEEVGRYQLAPTAELKMSPNPVRPVIRSFPQVRIAENAHQVARLRQVTWFRYQRIAVVEIQPYRHDKSTGLLERLKEIRLEFSYDKSELPMAAPEDPHSESDYAEMLVNYEQARQWRTDPTAYQSEIQTDTTGSWFNPASQYVRIALAADGIFRLSGAQLQSAGVLPPQADSRKADFFFKGRKLAVRMEDGGDGIFGPGDFLEFYGSKQYDSSVVLNEFSDTSVYWLTFDGSGESRAQVDSSADGSFDVTITSFPLTIRAEVDSFYFFGNGGLPANNTSDKVFGEGWYWKKILANQAASVSVQLANLFKSGNPSYTVRGRLHSPVVNAATPNHDVDIVVNGNVIGNIQFAGSQETLFSFSASSSLFVEGQNLVEVRSKPTGAPINEIFLDWVECDIQKTLVATGDALVFNGRQAVPGQIGQFQITGFLSQSIAVYRVDAFGSIEKHIRRSVSGSAPPYGFTFTDTVKAGSRYVALAEGSQLAAPVLSPKTFTDLRSSVHGADYLVITANALLPEANRLAQYRSQTNVGRTKVVLVEDIFDEFSFGMFDPFALRRFILAADTLWIVPRPSTLVLFGDANWDYRDHLKTGKRNIVPTLGNPVSDAWIVASKNDVFLPEKKVGRIPARTLQEAALFNDMIRDYEASSLSSWNKRLLFMASGFDSSETARFRTFTEGLISQTVAPPPVAAEIERLYRTSPVIVFEQTAEARRILEQGAVWMNFYGHAGTDFWGNGLSDPSQFINKENKRHIISDISCSTVRFGEPLVDSFSEKMLFGQAGGAAAYLGSSGFGYETPLRIIASSLFTRFSADTVRELGSLLQSAKLALYASGSSLTSRQSLQQMTLLGDPATRIRVARVPELNIVGTEVTVSPEQPSEIDDAVTISVPMRNFGLATSDSVLLRVNHSVDNDPPMVLDFRRPPLARLDTVVISHPAFSSGGSHALTLTIDPANLFPEESETNNTAQLSYFVGSGQVKPIAPLPSRAIHPDSVVLAIQNPDLPATASWTGLFEIDTSASFGSSGKITQAGVIQGKLATRWSVPRGLLSDSTVYYWRGTLTNGIDSTNWASGVFLTSTTLRTTWIQDRADLFRMNATSQVTVRDTISLLNQDIPLEVFSGGFLDGNDAAVWVNGLNISQGFANRGYNVAVLNQNSGEVEFFGAFSIYSDTPDTSLAEPLIQFLQGIPSGRRVLVAVADEASRNKTERLNQALESIGSGNIRSLGFRGSWAIIGWKGATPGSVPEGLSVSGGGPVTLQDTVLFQSIAGSITSPEIGPSARWRDVSVSTQTPPGTRVRVDLLRKFKAHGRDTVWNLSAMRDSLTQHLADTVLSVRLRLRLESDSAGISPFLIGWGADFDRAAELAVNYQSVRLLRDTVLEGESFSIEAEIVNLGGVSADSVRIHVGEIVNNLSSTFYQTVIPSILPDAEQGISTTFGTSGAAGRRKFFVQADPAAEIQESGRGDNLASLFGVVASDTLPPVFDVTFDGIRILDGDYVRGSPEIRISIRDNSPLAFADPNLVDVRIDGRRISLGSSPDSLFEPLTGPEKARATVRPALQKGTHTLSVQVLDVTGNPADSVAFEQRFRVETEAKLLNVVNVPNPFSRETALTFQLTGSTQPEEARLRIFTVGGRMIYDRLLLPGEINLGFNRIVWDGRDRDGDNVANGVYFYKIFVKVGGKSIEAIEKLARVR